MKRRLITLCLLLALLFSLPAQALELQNVSGWAQEELTRALELEILPESLFSAPMNQPITRLEFCQALMLTYELLMAPCPTGGEPFPDTLDPSALAAADLGLVTGYPDGSFRPFSEITREELMVMLYRLMRLQDPSVLGEVSTLTRFPDRAAISGWAREAVAACTSAGIVNGAPSGSADPKGMTTREQAIALLVRLTQSDLFTGPEVPEMTLAEYLAIPELTAHGYRDSYNTVKHCYIFGSTEVSRYDTSAVKLVTVTVPVWKLNTATGEKYASTASFQINSRLEMVVRAIFQEIYEGEERFPLNDVGGYRTASATSEHTTGLAIDLNAGSNPEMSKSLDPYEQGYRPGEDPLSIPADGDVVRAFNKYGFFWAGEGWSSKYDFMHFSYLGT